MALAVCLLSGQLSAADERTISLYNIHTKDTLTVTYKRDGRFLPDAMEKLNWHLRDWRQNKPTKMDPRLIDLVWEIHAELGSRAPVHVISGYRSPVTNNMLRRSRGGQARRSMHLLGKAMDVRFPDVPVRRLRYSALLRQQGGVGYYPTSAMPFVHVDTGRVRHWPRMSRQELALLFPDGQTRHRPRGGGPISPEDARSARQENPLLARRIAAFYEARQSTNSSGRTRIASASRVRFQPPRLLQGPRLQHRATARRLPVTRPEPPRQRVAALDPAPFPYQARPALSGWQTTARAATPSSEPEQIQRTLTRPSAPVSQKPKAPASRTTKRPSKPQPPPAPQAKIAAADRAALSKFVSLIFGGPKPEAANVSQSPERASAQPLKEPSSPPNWISAPAYDEEHPDELHYRPFPIAPYITLTASPDDKSLTTIHAPAMAQQLITAVDNTPGDTPAALQPGTAIKPYSARFAVAAVQ